MERGQERARLVWWALPLPSSAAARILWFAAQRPMRSYPTDPFSSHLERLPACLLARLFLAATPWPIHHLCTTLGFSTRNRPARMASAPSEPSERC